MTFSPGLGVVRFRLFSPLRRLRGPSPSPARLRTGTARLAAVLLAGGLLLGGAAAAHAYSTPYCAATDFCIYSETGYSGNSYIYLESRVAGNWYGRSTAAARSLNNDRSTYVTWISNYVAYESGNNNSYQACLDPGYYNSDLYGYHYSLLYGTNQSGPYDNLRGVDMSLSRTSCPAYSGLVTVNLNASPTKQQPTSTSALGTTSGP